MDWTEQQARYGALIQPRQQQPQTKPQPKKKKNFLLDQISTAGGILGGIGGSFVSPLVGTAAGAGFGSAAGESLENLLTGDSLGKNVAREGALGAVFGVGPIRGAKALAGAGKAALTGGRIAEGAAQAAASTIRGKAGQVVSEAGDDLLIKQFRLTPTQLKNFKSKFGEDAAQVIKRYGFKNADDVVAKGVEPLQKQFDEAITGIPGVVKNDLAQAFKSKYDPLLKSAVQDNVAIGKNLRSQSQAILKKYGNVVDAKELNSLRREFDALVNYTERTTNPARYGVNKRAADAIRTTLQKSDPSGGLKGIGRELQKLNQFADNAAKQAQLGRGSNPLGLTTLLGGGMGAAAGGPAVAAGSALGTAAINSPTGRRALAGGAEALGNKLTSSGARSATRGLSPLSIAGRVGGAGLLRGGVGATPDMSQEEQPQSLEDTLLQLGQGAGIPNQFSGQPEQPQDTSPYTRENLIADITRDPTHSNDYIQHFADLQEVFAPQENDTLKLNNTAIQSLTDLQTGLDNLGGLEQRISQSGANSPFLGGIRSSLPFDTEAKSLRAEIDRVKQVVGKALEGGVLRKEDEDKYARILPTINDTDAVAMNKIAAIRQDLQNKLNTFYTNQRQFSGKSSLEDALMGAQTQAY